MKYLNPTRRAKLNQSSPKSLKTCGIPMPVIVPYFIVLGQMMYEKCYKKYTDLRVTGRPTKGWLVGV